MDARVKPGHDERRLRRHLDSSQGGRGALPTELRKRTTEMSNPKKVTASSGNVFADLGFANPEEELLKAKLVREIRGILKRRKLTQTRAAVILGLKQPDVSALVTGRVGKFSIDRLVRCLHPVGLQGGCRCVPHAASGGFKGDRGLIATRQDRGLRFR